MKVAEKTKLPLLFDTQEGRTLSILLVLALALRLYLVFHTYVITNDGILYVKMSKLIAQGQIGAAFGISFFNLYPLLTVVFQKVFGDWEFSAQMVSAVFGSLTVIPFYLLVRSLFNRRVAVISSVFFVFHPYLVRFSAEVIRGPTFWFFFVSAFWLGWEAISRRRAGLFFLAGFSGALAFLLRPEGIIAAPVVAAWVLLKEDENSKSATKQRIFFALIVLLTLPMVLSPAMVTLRIKSGRWHLARAEDIPKLVFSNITAKTIKKDFNRLEIKPWDSDPDTADNFIRLRQFLSLATEHRIGVVVLEMMSKFQKSIHPLLLILLIFGTIRRRALRYHKKEELFLLSALTAFLLVLLRYGTVTFYIGTRHMMVAVLLCLPWIGAGVGEVEERLRNLVQTVKSTGTQFAEPTYVRWFLMGLIILALLPKGLASQRLDKMPMREAGVWIREHGPKNSVVVGQGHLTRIAFYADGRFLEIPQSQDPVEYLEKNRADFLAVNEKDVDKTHPGLIDSLDPSFFKKEFVAGNPSGPYVIRVYSVRIRNNRGS